MFQLHPVKASEWLTISEANKKLLKSVGALPVNDVFYQYWQNPAQVKLYRGGRGGGKSEIKADELVDDCLNQPYFKCYFGRKVFDDVRGSSFATLIASIEKSNLQRYFHYSTANTSAMIITCKNGNKFIPFGADKAEKLKSIKDPTHIWCEEFDQFTFEDFMEFFPTLRTIRGKNEFSATFNGYSVHETHWILKYFYPDLYKGEDKPEFNPLNGINVLDVLANYVDNYFIDQEDYERKLRLSSGGNDTLFQGLANGAWGVNENKNPWLYAFDAAKHVKDDIPFIPSYPIYLSFDFNNDPFTCTVFQMSPHKGAYDSFIHIIKEFAGSFKIEEMCNRIKTAYPNSIMYITGDRSGQNADLGRNQTLYQIIAGFLEVNNKLLNLNNSNLEHADSRIMLNAMFANYPNLFISRKGCPDLIRDCNTATVDSENKKPSALLKDRQAYKMDLFDAMRYFFQTYFHSWAKDNYFRAMKK